MNTKGQLGVGAIVMLAVAIIVGLVLISGNGGIAGEASKLTGTSSIVNETFTLAALNGFTDRSACVNLQGSATVINNSAGGQVVSTLITATTRVSPTTGYKVLTFRTDTAGLAGGSVNATYTCLPQGYAEDSASRAIVPLITLFCALAIAVVALSVAIKKGAFD